MFSRRDSASRGLFAWQVVMEPSCPVFIAWSISSASAPRHSPTMMRSGRMRSVLMTRSRIVMRPCPSTFAGRASRRQRFSCESFSSAESSTVMMRSFSGMNCERMFSRVVLPEPVPPETRILRRARTASRRKRAIGFVRLPNLIRSSSVSFFEANLRIVTSEPSSASGGMTAFTREPSSRRASTIGEAASMWRPSGSTMRWMIACRCDSLLNFAAER